jgi:hypothetical protein
VQSKQTEVVCFGSLAWEDTKTLTQRADVRGLIHFRANFGIGMCLHGYEVDHTHPPVSAAGPSGSIAMLASYFVRVQVLAHGDGLLCRHQ